MHSHVGSATGEMTGYNALKKVESCSWASKPLAECSAVIYASLATMLWWASVYLVAA